MDHLLDDAHVIEIEGDSYRNPQANKREVKRKARAKKEESA